MNFGNHVQAPAALSDTDGLPEQRRRLAICRGASGAIGSPHEIRQRALVKFGGDSMMGRQVQYLFGALSGSRLEPLDDAAV